MNKIKINVEKLSRHDLLYLNFILKMIMKREEEENKEEMNLNDILPWD